MFTVFNFKRGGERGGFLQIIILHYYTWVEKTLKNPKLITQYLNSPLAYVIHISFHCIFSRWQGEILGVKSLHGALDYFNMKGFM